MSIIKGICPNCYIYQENVRFYQIGEKSVCGYCFSAIKSKVDSRQKKFAISKIDNGKQNIKNNFMPYFDTLMSSINSIYL